MKIYLKKSKYNELFYRLFNIKIFRLHKLLNLDDIWNIIINDDYLRSSFTKQSLYNFAVWSYNMYIHIAIIYVK